MIDIKIGDFLDILKLYPNKYFDLVLTDPPYGIGEKSANNRSRKRKVGYTKNIKTNWHSSQKAAPVLEMEYNWDHKLSLEHINEILRVSKNQIIFGGNYYADWLPPSPCWIIWDKKNGNSDFADCELAWTSFKSSVRMFSYRWNGMLQEDMKNKERRVYPTQKPVALFKWILSNYCKPGWKVCDPCCGSGTTLRACRELKLDAFGIEKNPVAYEIIRERALINIPNLVDFGDAQK